MTAGQGSTRPLSKRLFARAAIRLERLWDDYRARSFADDPVKAFRIVSFIGHGGAEDAVVRGRVVDGHEPAEAVEGESVWAALKRNVARFRTNELPDVPLRIRVDDAEVETRTDGEGYFDLRLDADLGPDDAPWTTGEARLAEPYRGIDTPHDTYIKLRVPGPDANVAIVSDVDDTLLDSGATNPLQMIRRTMTGSALTRRPVPGGPALYRALAGGASGGEENPFFYISSSAWNLHGFLTAFLRHNDFPTGPLMLRDLLGTDANRTHSTMKRQHIDEVIDVHERLPVVLFGDSGQHDPQIYAEVVEENPDRIVAAYIRDVDAGPDDEGLEDLSDRYGVDADVPFLLAKDSTAIAEHAAAQGLLAEEDIAAVKAAEEAARGPLS